MIPSPSPQPPPSPTPPQRALVSIPSYALHPAHTQIASKTTRRSARQAAALFPPAGGGQARHNPNPSFSGRFNVKRGRYVE